MSGHLKCANKKNDYEFTNKDIKKNNVKNKRSCLMCGKLFNSKGIHNRRCPKCSRLAELHSKEIANVYKVYKVSHKPSSDAFNFYLDNFD